jgi:hypothetical protein
MRRLSYGSPSLHQELIHEGIREEFNRNAKHTVTNLRIDSCSFVGISTLPQQ